MTAQVVDENSCTSVNLQPIQVLVSTIPIFNAQVTSPMCTGVPGFRMVILCKACLDRAAASAEGHRKTFRTTWAFFYL